MLTASNEVKCGNITTKTKVQGVGAGVEGVTMSDLQTTRRLIPL